MLKFELHFETNARGDWAPFNTLAGELFENYTMQTVYGVWQHTGSEAFIFSFIGKIECRESVKYLARYIKAHFHQDAVLYTESPIVSELI